MDSLMAMHRLEDGIREAIRQDNDDHLWQLYLHTFPQGSFKDWKEKTVINTPKEVSQTEMTTLLDKSQNILNNFKP